MDPWTHVLVFKRMFFPKPMKMNEKLGGGFIPSEKNILVKWGENKTSFETTTYKKILLVKSGSCISLEFRGTRNDQ